jgi:hypothetical protein
LDLNQELAGAATSISPTALRFLAPVRVEGVEFASRPSILWMFGLFFGAVLFLRCPGMILHAEFWAEDGVVWYADPYAAGWHSLFFPKTAISRRYSRLPPADFTEKAREFALAPPGTRMELPLQPPGWR